MIRLTVSDQGPGISPEDQARVFERFEQAVGQGRHGGFGVGLWLARQLVEAMGGRIIVESREGEGSTFSVLIPGVDLSRQRHDFESDLGLERVLSGIAGLDEVMQGGFFASAGLYRPRRARGGQDHPRQPDLLQPRQARRPRRLCDAAVREPCAHAAAHGADELL